MEGGESEEEELEAPLLLPVGVGLNNDSSADHDDNAAAADTDDEASSHATTSSASKAKAWRNRTLIATFAVVDFTTNLAVSVVFPFLPQSLERNGAGPYQRGLVFAALPLGVLMVSPLVPPLLWRVGPVSLLTGSLTLLAFCLVACALWAGPYDHHHHDCSSFPTATTASNNDDAMTNNATTATNGTAAGEGAGAGCEATAAAAVMYSVVAWVTARLVMGFGTACTSVTALCLVTRHMPESMSFANGVLESAIGKKKKGEGEGAEMYADM